MKVAFVAILGTTAFALTATSAWAQYSSGYGSYYTQNVTKPGGTLGAQSSSRYLYDKYFYQRPTVSPYLNVGRPGSDMAASYQTYVRPEQQRREAAETASRAYVQQRKLEGNVGDTRLPGAAYGGGLSSAILKPAAPTKATPSSYYNHWYGGWANR